MPEFLILGLVIFLGGLGVGIGLLGWRRRHRRSAAVPPPVVRVADSSPALRRQKFAAWRQNLDQKERRAADTWLAEYAPLLASAEVILQFATEEELRYKVPFSFFVPQGSRFEVEVVCEEIRPSALLPTAVFRFPDHLQLAENKSADFSAYRLVGGLRGGIPQVGERFTLTLYYHTTTYNEPIMGGEVSEAYCAPTTERKFLPALGAVADRKDAAGWRVYEIGGQHFQQAHIVCLNRVKAPAKSKRKTKNG